MTTPIYTSPFTGTVVTPTDVSYSTLSFSTDTQLFWPSIVNQGNGQAPATRIIDCTASAPSSYLITSNTTTTFNTADTSAVTNLPPGSLITFGSSATTYSVVSVGIVGSFAQITFTPSISLDLVGQYAFTVNGPTILLPEADQGTVGADILFRNIGSNSFTITDFKGQNSVAVPVGISKYFYLTNNSSAAGTWGNVTFGAGTSSADAASLAGAGLTTVSGKLATTQNIVDITTTPTLNDSSRAATLNWSGGNGNINLPNSSVLSRGWFIGFRNNGTGSVSFTPVAPQLINGISSITTNPGDSGFIFFDYTTNGFITVGWTTPNDVVFTAATYDVDSIAGNTFNLSSNAPIIQTYVAQSGTRTSTLNVTLPAITQLYVLFNNTNQAGYNISFQNQGSTQTPVELSTGNTYLLLSDGEFLYILSESATAVYKATNGNTEAPSYSFLNDTRTGMYLDGVNILGISANAQELIRIDNTNTIQPLVTINARVAATLISGGTF